MASIYDVAKYISYKQGKVDNWKLQKLCYYAQAWSLAWTEHPLFEEDFQAWSNGPVCEELYHSFEGKYELTAEDIKGDISVLTEDELDTINVVLKDYGGKDAYWLREQTQAEYPWKKAGGSTIERVLSMNIITKDSMGEYYGSL